MDFRIVVLLALLLGPLTTFARKDEGWPKQFEKMKWTIGLYQPQLESLKDVQLKARMAVSAQKKGLDAPAFGSVWFTATFTIHNARSLAPSVMQHWERSSSVQIKFASIMVADQNAALNFYTSVLGFKKMADLPIGEFRWLTVVSPDGIEGVELVLEPLSFPPSKAYQKALFDAGVPAAALISSDLQNDYKRLKERGVVFRGEPRQMGVISAVVFEDTCGNLINLVQPHLGSNAG
jgi:catechol 2,3-dioxygenase-like lactoylglutathione lyase family enzyme